MFSGRKSGRSIALVTALALVMLFAINPVGAYLVGFGASPSTVTVAAGGSVSTTITLTKPADWTGLGVACSTGLPAGASCSTSLSLVPFPIDIPASPPPFTFTVTISTSPSTPPGTYTVTVVLRYAEVSTIISPGFAISPGVSRASASGGIGPASISIQQVPQQVSTNITLIIPGPIPEYPLGLPILAVFMVLVYGLIRRRTKNPKNA